MDPLSSSKSQVFVNANKLEQTKTITCMDYDSYNAAAEGKIEVFKDITYCQSLHLLLTPNENTILHIYITALNSKPKSTTPIARLESTTTINARSKSITNFVEEILEMCPPLLQQANVKGETPLHIAARYGHDDIVEVLIKYCAQTIHKDLEGGIEPIKEMLRMTNKEKDTALHEAVRYNHLKVVKLLIEEDPNFSYSANDSDETPLYIAAERGFKDVVIEILDKCKSPMHGGPLGRTALHATIMNYHSSGMKTSKMAERILDKIEGIGRIVDNDGWTPLHFAAYAKYSSSLAKMLLDKDRDVAYMKDTKGKTALHIAAQRGSLGIVDLIVSKCPDCCELIDNRGWNVLHFAMKGRYLSKFAIQIILGNSSLSNLLNEKNADGDTPLHYYFNTEGSAKNFVGHPRVDKMAFNKNNLSAWDIAKANSEVFPKEKESEIMEIMETRPDLPRRVIAYEDDDDTTKLEYWMKEKEKEKKKEEKEKEKRDQEKRSMLQKACEAHLVVGALITTVTFAACITMPGGFVSSGEGRSSHPGSALLRKNAAFTTFIITDTISMVLSSSAVFIHLLMPFLFNKSYDADKLEKLHFLAFRFILWAMIAMGLAFVTGTYVVLVPSLGLAIANCIIGLIFFGILLFVFRNCIDLSFDEILHFLTGKFKRMERVERYA